MKNKFFSHHHPGTLSLFIGAAFFLLSCTAQSSKKVLEAAILPTVESVAMDMEDGPNTLRFTILQLNDVYEIAPLEKGRVGGMARVATIRKRLLQETDHVLTVMTGDFLSPSLLGTMKFGSERVMGRQMVEVMNSIGFDLVGFGNHEFDLKMPELQQRFNESRFEWLSTNTMYRKPDLIQPFFKQTSGGETYFPKTYTWTVSDDSKGISLKVGFYGACINDNQQPFVYYEDAYTEASKAYHELLDNTNVIVGITHLELPMDLKIASMLPQTALIMGGHEHENSFNEVGNVVITKADANAKTVYIHRFIYDIESKKMQLKSELLPVTDEIPDEPSVASVVSRWNNYQNQQISTIVSNPGEVIYNAIVPLDGLEKSVRNQQTNLGKLLGAGIGHAGSAAIDCVFFNSGSIRVDDHLSGELTAVDIFRTLPFGGSLFEVEMKGSLLQKVLNAGLENKGKGGYLQWYNIALDEVSKGWKIADEWLVPDKVYRIMTNDYVFAGSETRLEFLNKNNPDVVKWATSDEKNPNDLRSDVRKAIIAYLKSIER